ncbi:MAG TPA: hypothetical protein VFM46_00780 [Pseudomonadales bacterium]|nr:hypothetical protein [Pseudomonadales bacterium]
MKIINFPFLLDPKLRRAVEQVLEAEETLTGFIEKAIREQIKQRQMQQVFIARSLSSCENALRNGEYNNAEDILRELDKLLVTDDTKY